MSSDSEWMAIALAEASLAAEHDDVPVGAVVVHEGRELGRGRNRRELDGDPTAHAEIVALRAAALEIGTWRLDGSTLYVTLEPCTMCAGAIVQARIGTLVFGADDAKAGAVVSLFDVVRDPRLPHVTKVVRGVDADTSSELLRDFFALRRG
jgi:tRNA(adenine34) deaminase